MSSQPSLTEAQAEILRGQVIDDTHPGAILHDFQAVLDYVGLEGVKSSGKYNLLPLDALTTLNQRLARPLRLKLKRPQVRSQPYLQGLNLLLRATGLGTVIGTGAKARLALAPDVLASWNALNPTERYFTLLEAWLRLSRPEMIGERGWRGASGLLEAQGVWRAIPAGGSKSASSSSGRTLSYLFYGRLHHLALMDLFGLVEVEHARAPVQHWAPARLMHSPFGDAVFTLLDEHFPSPWMGEGDEDDEEGPAAPDFGRWQPIFQPYFPAWRNNLVVPEAEARDGVFVFRVTLGAARRVLAVPAGVILDRLAAAILKSVNFDNDHLYDFSYRDRFGVEAKVNHPYVEEPPFTDEVTVGEVPLNPGQSMRFLFDYGDSWEFDVRLERIDPPEKKLKAPRLLESHGKAPKQYGYDDWEEE
jgi:hypothetical protein